MRRLQQSLSLKALQPGTSLHRRKARRQAQRGSETRGRRERRGEIVDCSQSSMLGRFNHKAPAHWTQSSSPYRVLRG